MAGAQLKVEGAKELRRALKYIGDEGLVVELKAANREAGDLVVRRALPNVPVRTGRLKSSVKALGSQRDAKVKAGSARAPHAAAIHWGRRVGNVGSPPGNRKGRNPIRGRPFLHDAAKQSHDEVVAAFGDAMERLIRTIRTR